MFHPLNFKCLCTRNAQPKKRWLPWRDNHPSFQFNDFFINKILQIYVFKSLFKSLFKNNYHAFYAFFNVVLLRAELRNG